MGLVYWSDDIVKLTKENDFIYIRLIQNGEIVALYTGVACKGIGPNMEKRRKALQLGKRIAP